RGVERTVFSNATGLYRFNEVPVGQQVVIARRPGYEAVERVVTIAAGQIALVDFRLVRMPQQLDSVTVTGERFQPVLIGYVHDTFGRPVVG
ncbi:MAG: carboxypeptidase regulatory-like domain-containing protein, partial [Gemmatimonadales bacterium]|nr:carboxypeptidase regulatory-like domain-containing protein [Gemmatimonadales bacterium]